MVDELLLMPNVRKTKPTTTDQDLQIVIESITTVRVKDSYR